MLEQVEDILNLKKVYREIRYYIEKNNSILKWITLDINNNIIFSVDYYYDSKERLDSYNVFDKGFIYKGSRNFKYDDEFHQDIPILDIQINSKGKEIYRIETKKNEIGGFNTYFFENNNFIGYQENDCDLVTMKTYDNKNNLVEHFEAKESLIDYSIYSE